MNEKDFLATLKAYLESESEFEILGLMNPCELSFNNTSVFASKSYQFRAYVDIRVPINKMKKLKEHSSRLFGLCKDIYIEDEEYALYGVDIKPMIMKAEEYTEESKICDQSNQVDKRICVKERFKVSDKSVECISQTVTGDNGKSFYRKGYELVKFFNQFGFNDIYGPGFPSRIDFAREKITKMNIDFRINEVIETLLDPRDYIENEFSVDSVVEYINQYLVFDNLLIVKENEFYKLRNTKKNENINFVEPKKLEVELNKIAEANEKRKPKLFFSYSHKDEELRNELEKHLIMLKRKNIIDTWHDRVIDSGSVLDEEIDKNLEEADIVLLLISVDFLASNYCYDIEMKKALDMHANKEAVVIPVILRNCDWLSAPFANLMVVPTDGKSIVTWSDRDSAFLNVAKSIENIALKLIS